MNDYFSDRELGSSPSSVQIISPAAWKALVAIITIRLNTGAFMYRNFKKSYARNDRKLVNSAGKIYVVGL
jgi:hypothetical protein